ncbi:hypothetical protein GCM10027051_23250 [Niabella terrae]
MAVFAQEDIAAMRENARKFMQSNDVNNAILVLNKAREADSGNVDVQKDLALAYYYNRDFDKGVSIIRPLMESPDADPSVYQIAGNLYQAKEMYKEAETIYKDAIKTFPTSGPLYNDYGELLLGLKNPKAAIETWEKGMQLAPSFGGNYYNASIYYFKQPNDKIWAIIYGEIYANMESLNPRSNNIKKMVLDAYKQKLFLSGDLNQAAEKEKNPFVKAVLETFAKQSGISGQGITPESLAMIRTRFVLDWFAGNAAKFPFKLFDYQQQLMKDGLFDAYNQWMFGPVDNQSVFETWVNNNKEKYDQFTAFHTSRIFKMPKDQVYSVQ